MFNLQIILGNLGCEPEMRYTPQGKAVTTFSVASHFCFTRADGQAVKETEWFNVQTWSKQAEICHQYLKKGSTVLVLGRTKTESWTGEDQQKRSRKIVVADRVVFVNTRNGQAEQTDLSAAAPGESAGDAPF
jgi:single-strand DNA-binding protein